MSKNVNFELFTRPSLLGSDKRNQGEARHGRALPYYLNSYVLFTTAPTPASTPGRRAGNRGQCLRHFFRDRLHINILLNE